MCCIKIVTMLDMYITYIVLVGSKNLTKNRLLTGRTMCYES